MRKSRGEDLDAFFARIYGRRSSNGCQSSFFDEFEFSLSCKSRGFTMLDASTYFFV